MGFRVSWIARAGTSTDELLEASRRRPKGERHEFPDVGYDLTAEVGRRLVGFRHDVDPDTDDPEPFQVLV